MKYEYKLPAPGTIAVTGRARTYLDFITREQLMRRDLWTRFVEPYITHADVADRGWRGEYWGKMMRGACLTFRCTGDAALYAVLREAVEALLAAADPADGRISTYDRENEFSGWDIWCRKYVLTGMLHFYDICPDEALRERILRAMERHADCIIKRVGDGNGQIPITETSDFWLGVNSCSILEPFADLYKHTGERRFLEYAEYIVSTGGCSGGDLIALALEDTLSPCDYPENKAYETMSFFEGVLALYELTDAPRYLEAVLRFAAQVKRNEITIIGCAGCEHEQFDRAAVTQTEETGRLMQETCVTVTWMRLCARLFLLTGDDAWAADVERSALNALYGSVNLYRQPTRDRYSDVPLDLPFDSYSPLCGGTRGRAVGGLKFYADGFYYGCCACIGAAGLAVYPLIQALRTGECAPFTLREQRLNGKRAFTYGPYVLARDAAKEPADLSKPLRPVYENGAPRYTPAECGPGESVRLFLETSDGPVLLTDYASCGKKWAETQAPIAVWLPAGE